MDIDIDGPTEEAVSISDLMCAVSSDNAARGAFQYLVEIQGMASLEDLLQTCAGRGKEVLTWPTYVGMVSLSPLIPNGHLEAVEEASSLPSLDKAAYLLLLKLFDFTDTDKDETLTETEVLQVSGV